MSKILQAKNDLKKKMSFNDYSTPAQAPAQVQVPVAPPVYQQQAKIKATFYLSHDAQEKLTAIYIHRMVNNNKTDKSALISEAIDILYNLEKID